MNYYLPNQPRKKRKRLKKSVKRGLLLLLTVVTVFVLRPWNWGIPSSEAAIEMSIKQDTVIALNHILSNSDSDIPQADKFDKAVNQFMRKWDIVGASLAIMKDGNLIYSKGYGYADREDSTLTDVKHIFRVASVSKLITAVGIMKLYEQGKLNLASPVFGERGILNDPQFTDFTDRRVKDITVEHLLRHQGGFTVRAGDPMFNPLMMSTFLGTPAPATMNHAVQYAVKRGLGFRPGGRTVYSNLGYLVLSKVIEKVTGMPYEKYIKDSILTPIGCYDMHIASNLHEDKFPNEVRYYESSDAENIESYDGTGRMLPKCNGGNNVRGLSGAGAWVASPTELVKFVAAIDGDPSRPDILKRQTINIMTGKEKASLPIGWMHTNEHGEWWRTGSMAGTSAMIRKQNNGYVWVFITNTSSWKGSRFPNLINGMLKQAFGRVTEWPEKDMFAADSLSGEILN